MRLLFFVLGLSLVFSLTPLSASRAAAFVRPIVYPTDTKYVPNDDFGASRTGHAHEGNDIIGKKMVPLYAAVDGVVTSAPVSEPAWGYEIVLQDVDGYTYHYIHVNNDTPGTDDGNGGALYAYAQGITRGATVHRGQLVGWMGDSGNAETVGAHLHFEIRDSSDVVHDPHASLLAARAQALGQVIPTAVTTINTISENQNFPVITTLAPCVSDTLIKSTSTSAVYYCGSDGKRHGFPNERVYFTWYKDFKQVRTISSAELASIPLGKNVIYRAGIRLVKIESLPNVYEVTTNGVLRWLSTPQVATHLYGANWAKKVDDVSDALFIDYTIGTPQT